MASVKRGVLEIGGCIPMRHDHLERIEHMMMDIDPKSESASDSEDSMPVR